MKIEDLIAWEIMFHKEQDEKHKERLEKLMKRRKKEHEINQDRNSKQFLLNRLKNTK